MKPQISLAWKIDILPISNSFNKASNGRALEQRKYIYYEVWKNINHDWDTDNILIKHVDSDNISLLSQEKEHELLGYQDGACLQAFVS